MTPYHSMEIYEDDESIAEPDGTISEDQFRETNKRVKSKFVVPSNSPAPLGKRAEVINLD